MKFLRSFFLGPIPLFVIIGISLHFIFGGLNTQVSALLNNIGYLILPAVMFILGYRFVYIPDHLISSVVVTLIKMLVGFLLAWSFFLVIIFAEEQGLTKDFLVTFLPIAAVVSFFLLYFLYSTWGRVLV